jgi:hypothetical protein
VSRIHHLSPREHTIEVAGVDIKPAYRSSHPQFDDCPVTTALVFLCSSVFKCLPVRVGIVSTGFPAVIKSPIGTILPFQALGRLCEVREIGTHRIARGSTSVCKMFDASAKNSSDLDKIAPPSEALDNSGSKAYRRDTLGQK